jgi:hypothetical protein
MDIPDLEVEQLGGNSMGGAGHRPHAHTGGVTRVAGSGDVQSGRGRGAAAVGTPADVRDELAVDATPAIEDLDDIDEPALLHVAHTINVAPTAAHGSGGLRGGGGIGGATVPTTAVARVVTPTPAADGKSEAGGEPANPFEDPSLAREDWKSTPWYVSAVAAASSSLAQCHVRRVRPSKPAAREAVRGLRFRSGRAPCCIEVSDLAELGAGVTMYFYLLKFIAVRAPPCAEPRRVAIGQRVDWFRPRAPRARAGAFLLYGSYFDTDPAHHRRGQPRDSGPDGLAAVRPADPRQRRRGRREQHRD